MEHTQGLHHQRDKTTKVCTITDIETTKEPFFLPLGPSRLMLTELSAPSTLLSAAVSETDCLCPRG